jgi:hypothetical protein
VQNAQHVASGGAVLLAEVLDGEHVFSFHGILKILKSKSKISNHVIINRQYSTNRVGLTIDDYMNVDF